MPQNNGLKQTVESNLSMVEDSSPKTTRVPDSLRREEPQAQTTAETLRYKLDAFPDRIDVRDWLYQPTLQPLPEQVVNCHLIPKILDQGSEGACTGFALAAVINYQLAVRELVSIENQERLVSPRMLYEMARHYDEWPGEQYEGSSARGTVKGWLAHGVATQGSWPDDLYGTHHLSHELAEEAQRTPGGAYYRVMHRNIRDMHAAIHETGILYATIMIHNGWDKPGPETKQVKVPSGNSASYLELPIINRTGRADSGHAVAIVGYTFDGFIIQNSWGKNWGNRGFALLPYEDWLLHGTDCWVTQLGVPVSFNVWEKLGTADTSAGLQRAGHSIPLSEIRPYVVNIGNNGLLSNSGRYWTTEDDLTRLFESIQEQSKSWSKCRVMLYLHGGLNNEDDVANRIVAFREVCLENEIYPVHIMWETGLLQTLTSSVLDLFTADDERAGVNWVSLREGLIEAKDRSIELTVAGPGMILWKEMKENARLASAPAGGMDLFTQKAHDFLDTLSQAEKDRWELHIVGHSAGSIFAAHAIRLLIAWDIQFKSLQFMAPGISIELFKKLLLPPIRAGRCPHPTLYVLSDIGERDDTVGLYGKSLLYLVSNAFEGKRETPILGMERFISQNSSDPNKALVDPDIDAFLADIDGRPSLVIAGAGSPSAIITPNLSRSNTHSSFDNDEYTMNSVLYRILGHEPGRPFTLRDLQYELG